MKIAMVGCGALGSYYGAKFSNAGHDVHFLLRSDYDVVRQHGVTIRSVEGNFTAHPACALKPEEIGIADAIVIALKTTANHLFPALLPPLVGPDSTVITLQNGLGNEELLARLFPPAQIMGGLCFVCLNRTAPGVVEHMAHGKVVLGEFTGAPQLRTEHFRELFRSAGITCEITDNLARTHWEKLVWNIPFNGLGVAGAAGYEALAGTSRAVPAIGPVLPTDKLLGDPKWENLVRDLMREVITAANALGLTVAPELAEKQIQRTRSMGAYRASTLVDFERKQLLELESMFLEPLRQAKSAGVPMPRLERLCQVLEQLNPA